MIPIEQVKPYTKNPRKNDRAVELVAKSIKEFGFRNPIILDKNGEIIAGHTRLKAAEKLKLKEVPVIRAEDLTEEQVKAFRIMDNKSSEKAEWNMELLKEELIELQKEDFRLELTGFSFKELGGILENEIVEDIVEVNAYERAKSKTKIKQGEIYQLGDHRLMCGDATEKEDVGTLMGKNKADLLLTDPPYGNLIITDKKGRVGKSNIAECQEYHKYKNEGDFDIEPLLKFVDEYCEKKVIFGGNYFAHLLPITTSWICWDKRAGDHSWFSDFELAWTNLGIPARLFKITWQGMIREGESGKRNHPTQKPIKLFAEIIRLSKTTGDILDLFGGSGSTLIACEQLNRKCFMLELDPVYCQVIIDRWQKLTRKTAKKI